MLSLRQKLPLIRQSRSRSKKPRVSHRRCSSKLLFGRVLLTGHLTRLYCSGCSQQGHGKATASLRGPKPGWGKRPVPGGAAAPGVGPGPWRPWPQRQEAEAGRGPASRLQALPLSYASGCLSSGQAPTDHVPCARPKVRARNNQDLFLKLVLDVSGIHF